MRIHLIGTGDAFGSGGRFQSCLRLSTASGADMLVDCGASSIVALNRAGIDRNGIRTILFTHFHGDHFMGLPFFMLEAQFVTKRTQPLLIAGPRCVEERVRVAMEAAFPGSATAQRGFPVTFLEVTPESPARIDGVAITAFPVVHDERAGPCQGYRLEHDGRVFALSGDTGWTDSLITLADGADVLLIECYERSRKLPAHLDWDTIRDRLPDLKAKRILLTHRGPAMLACTEDLPVERAEDGLEICL